jgi:glycosyltransferase involved in cell wall biosynthesis
MKIAFPYTGYWPYVRRGVERCTHDLATYLAGRGHEVHVITSTPGRPRVAWDGDVKVTYLSQLNHPLVYKYSPLLRVDLFAVGATKVMRRERPDVAWLWTYSGIRWASLLRRFWKLPYIYHVSVYWERGRGHLIFPELPGANRVLALNHHAAEQVEQEFKVECSVLSPPVDTDFFRPCAPRDLEHPVVLFPADLADPRKGGSLLLMAWNHVHRRMPRARLVLGGSLGVAGWLQDQKGLSMISQLGLVKDEAARAAVELRGPGALHDLPALYSSAAVTVLPSVHEMFGMVLTESLACGTPVVASAHHGPGEILTDPSVGATVDLRDTTDLASSARAEELAGAILRAIELARQPGTQRRCREFAMQWSLERIGPLAELELERAASSPTTRVGTKVAVAEVMR